MGEGWPIARIGTSIYAERHATHAQATKYINHCNQVSARVGVAWCAAPAPPPVDQERDQRWASSTARKAVIRHRGKKFHSSDDTSTAPQRFKYGPTRGQPPANVTFGDGCTPVARDQCENVRQEKGGLHSHMLRSDDPLGGCKMMNNIARTLYSRQLCQGRKIQVNAR